MNTLKIIFTSDDQHGLYEKDEVGYIYGWMNGFDGTPCAVILKESCAIVMAPLLQIKAIDIKFS